MHRCTHGTRQRTTRNRRTHARMPDQNQQTRRKRMSKSVAADNRIHDTNKNIVQTHEMSETFHELFNIMILDH